MMTPLVDIVDRYQWIEPSRFRLGKRHSMVQQAYEMKAGSSGGYLL